MEVLKYTKGQLFKSTLHLDTYYSIETLPEYTIRKDKKVVFKNDKYRIGRIPDQIVYKSKYDQDTKTFKLKDLEFTEEQINLYLDKGLWQIL